MSGSGHLFPADAVGVLVGAIILRPAVVMVCERLVHLTLTATLGEETLSHLDAMYRVANAQWIRNDPNGAPPEFPAEQVYDQLRLRLDDDLGTKYALVRRTVGGTVTEWRAEYKFTPGPPPLASILVVNLIGEDADTVSHTIRLGQTSL